jgi:hypothetical protein
MCQRPGIDTIETGLVPNARNSLKGIELGHSDGFG